MEIDFFKTEISPLLPIPNKFGIENLYLKDETINPTHTFKDRLAVEMLSPIIENINNGKKISRTTFGSISYGNTAFSMGYFCRQLNRLYGSEIVNAICFIPRELRSRTIGPDTSGKYLLSSEMLKKINLDCQLIEIDLNGKIFREKDLEKLARNFGYCFENYVDVTEGLNRVSYEGIISEVIEQQLKQVPDYIIVPFGAGILCNEIKDYIQDKKFNSVVIPVSSGDPNTIAQMLYGPIWVDSNELINSGKAYTKHDKVDKKGRNRIPYLVYNVSDGEILNVLPDLHKIGISAEPSAASGFAILNRLQRISPEFNPEKHNVLVINTGNGLLNHLK